MVRRRCIRKQSEDFEIKHDTSYAIYKQVYLFIDFATSLDTSKEVSWNIAVKFYKQPDIFTSVVNWHLTVQWPG